MQVSYNENIPEPSKPEFKKRVSREVVLINNFMKGTDKNIAFKYKNKKQATNKAVSFRYLIKKESLPLNVVVRGEQVFVVRSS